MNPQLREKIALIIFVILAFCGLCALLWYLVFGHSWNVTASHIDDSVGRMDGYTVIAFEGVLPFSDQEDEKGLLKEFGIPQEPRELQKRVSAEDAARSYESKGAHTFCIDTLNPSKYEEGMILKRGDYRLGVISIVPDESRNIIQKQVNYFQKHEVNCILVITSNREQLEQVGGINLVIDTNTTNDAETILPESLPSGAYCVQAPIRGIAGAFIISPSNVVSAKAVTSLE